MRSKSLFNSRRERPEAPCATLVTAFLHPRSASGHKHTIDEYMSWAERVLELEAPLYVFVERDLQSFVRERRPAHLAAMTKVVIFEEGDMRVSRYPFWQQQWEIDPERSYHSVAAYKVWNEKSEFLQKAAADNAFSTPYFFWIDLGYFRDSSFAALYRRRPLDPAVVRTIPRDTVLILQVRPIDKRDLSLRIDGLPRPVTGEVHLAAGLFGGTAAACARFHALYYPLLERMEKSGRFVGKEQDMFYTLAVLHPEAVSILVTNDRARQGRNVWFETARFLAGGAAHEIRDVSSASIDPSSPRERLRRALRRARGLASRALARLWRLWLRRERRG